MGYVCTRAGGYRRCFCRHRLVTAFFCCCFLCRLPNRTICCFTFAIHRKTPTKILCANSSWREWLVPNSVGGADTECEIPPYCEIPPPLRQHAQFLPSELARALLDLVGGWQNFQRRAHRAACTRPVVSKEAARREATYCSNLGRKLRNYTNSHQTRTFQIAPGAKRS